MSGTKTRGSATPYVIAVIVTGFVIFLVYIMFFMPKVKEAAQVRKGIETVAAEIKIQDAQLDEIGIHIAGLSELEAGMDTFNQAFTLDPEQKRLFEAITSAASASNVSLFTLNPVTPALPEETEQVDEAGEPVEAAPPVLASVGIKLEARGSFAGLNEFMRAIENMERPVSIKTFEITPVGDDLNAFQLGANVVTWMADPLPAPTVGEDGTINPPADEMAQKDVEG